MYLLEFYVLTYICTKISTYMSYVEIYKHMNTCMYVCPFVCLGTYAIRCRSPFDLYRTYIRVVTNIK